jgi:prepilin-type N-terminal cleavage/methylation domain-containing protein
MIGMNNRDEIKGFTLIELLVVIAIIGILSAIAIPAYIGVQTRAARSEAKANLQSLRLLEEQFFAENGNYTANLADITAIKSVLTGFKPGNEADLKFTYKVDQNKDIDGTAQTPCFRAIATGKTGTNVSGEIYRIDCNNNRFNF